jgi:N-formylglutamate amidohydrolase
MKGTKMIQLERGVFMRFDPEAASTPLIVDVSRSGREYPTDFRSNVPFTVVHDNVSMYVDEIWSAAPKLGGTLLYAAFPHVYIDANRNELDLDAELIEGEWPVPLKPNVSLRGLGLLKAKSRYGEPMQERRLTVSEIMERLERYHRPYFAELDRIIKDKKQKFGRVYQLSCHCMSAIGAPTHPDPGQERADFCLGDLEGKTASPEFIDFVAEFIRRLGFSCTINTPYAGGELNARFGDPLSGIESIMVEINKKKFMDIMTFKKNQGFIEIQAAATRILEAVLRYAADHFSVN